jgi:hypothetical protein
MRSTVRQISVILLLAALLVPGLLQARTPVRHSAHTVQSAQSVQTPGFFSSVWSLLTNSLLKAGTTLDPSGTGTGSGSGGATSSSGTGDAGTVLDPSGGTK